MRLLSREFIALAAFLVLGTGCTIHRVGVVESPGQRPRLAAAEVQVAPRMTEGRPPAGMARLIVMPILRSNPETRAALAKDRAAELGFDRVVALQSYEDIYARWPVGVCLFDSSRMPAGSDRPKFTVCMPPPRLLVQDTPVNRTLAEYIRLQVEYEAPERGYYVYSTEVSDIGLESMQEGKGDPSRLAEPIGAEPDFVLFADLKGYDESGTQVLMKFRMVEIVLTLVDVKERRVVWTVTEKNGMSEGLLSGLAVALATSADEDMREAVRSTVNTALRKVPVVPGYRKLK